MRSTGREGRGSSDLLLAGVVALVAAVVIGRHLALAVSGDRLGFAVGLLLGLLLATLAVVCWVKLRGKLHRPVPLQKSQPPREGLALERELRRLRVGAPGGERIALGHAGRYLVAAERLQSVLVVGPSQSGKTTSLAVPAICEWAGPVLATSVKSDLVRGSIERRRQGGEVAVYDPTGSSGLERVGWSPLSASSSWQGARRTAASLCSLGRHENGIEDASFWYASAERLLAPLLRAAAASGSQMSAIVGWLEDERSSDAVLALELAGESEAARAASSFLSMDERQRSSVFATARTVVEAYADPAVAESELVTPRVDAGWLYGGERRTLYLCAPSREQARLSPVFVALVQEVLEAGYKRAAETGPLSPGLLVVLDEAANIAPLPDLDQLVSTSVGHGVAFLTVWQDLAQIEARYGGRFATIVNNHRAKVVLPGIADPRTLELVSSLAGEAHTTETSLSRSSGGQWSETEAPSRLPVAPAAFVRRLDEGHLLLLYHTLPPALLRLRRSAVAVHRSFVNRALSAAGWRGCAG